jgi:chromosome segregation ATPase
MMTDMDNKNNITTKKHQKKCQELQDVKEKLSSLQETQHITENKFNDLENELFSAKDTIRLLEKEKSELLSTLDNEKMALQETTHKLQEEKDKNTELNEVIDRQKFDLDEARSGLRYYTTSPIMVKRVNFILREEVLTTKLIG